MQYLDTIHRAILRHCSDGFTSLSGLYKEADHPRSTVYDKKDDLLDANLIENRSRDGGPGSEYRTTERGTTVLREASQGPPQPNIPELHRAPTREHKAVISLVLAAAASRQSEVTEAHHPWFLLGGDTLKWKTWTAKFCANLLDLDPADVITLMSTETGRSLFKRKGHAGETVSENPLLSQPLACLDEMQEAREEVLRDARAYLQGELTLLDEGDPVEVDPVSIVTLNFPEESDSDPLAARTPFDDAQLRRAVTCDFNEVSIPDGEKPRGDDHLEAAAAADPVSLPDDCHPLDVGETIAAVTNDCLSDDAGPVDHTMLRVLASGMNAFYDDEQDALHRSLADWLWLAETRGWTSENWQGRLRDVLAEHGDIDDGGSGEGSADQPADSMAAESDPSGGSQTGTADEKPVPPAIAVGGDVDALKDLSGPAKDAAIANRKQSLKKLLRRTFSDLVGGFPSEFSEEGLGLHADGGEYLGEYVENDAEERLAQQIWYLAQTVDGLETATDVAGLEQTVEELIDWRDYLGTFESQRRELETEIGRLEDEKITLQEDLDRLDRTRESLQEVVEGLRATRTDEEDSLEELRAERTEEEERLEAARIKADSIERVTDLREECDRRGVSPEDVLDELDAHPDLIAETEQLREEVATANERLSDLTEQIETRLETLGILDDIEHFDERLLENATRYEDLEALAADLGYDSIQEFTRTLEEKRAVSEEVQQLEQVVSDKRDEIEGLDEEIGEKNEHIETAEKRSAELDQEIRQKMEYLEDLNRETADLEEDIEQQENHLETVTEELEAKRDSSFHHALSALFRDWKAGKHAEALKRLPEDERVSTLVSIAQSEGLLSREQRQQVAIRIAPEYTPDRHGTPVMGVGQGFGRIRPGGVVEHSEDY